MKVLWRLIFNFRANYKEKLKIWSYGLANKKKPVKTGFFYGRYFG